MTNPYDSRMPSAQERDAFIDVLRSRQSQKHRDAMEVIDRVNQKYVTCGRDDVVRELFDEFLTYTMAKQPNSRVGKGEAFYITGESGAGKSYVTERLLTSHPVLQPIDTPFGPKLPYVALSLRGPATLATLGNDILKLAGYASRRKIAQGDVWGLIPTELAPRGIFLIHIDETQHLLAHKHEREDLVKSLKGLMNDPSWPMRFVLSGMPEINDMLAGDEQAERRNFSLQLESVRLPSEERLVHRIVEELCEAAGLASDQVIHSDLPERICHAANYQYGRIAEVVVFAIHSAVLADAAKTALDRNDFARAYLKHSHARGRPDVNPFLTDHWRDLKPGYFIVKGSK